MSCLVAMVTSQGPEIELFCLVALNAPAPLLLPRQHLIRKVAFGSPASVCL